MASTNQWRVNNPQLGVEYVMPNGFWVVPNNGTSFTIQWNAYKADGAGARTMTCSVINRDITTASDVSNLTLSDVNGITYIPSSGHNGTDIFAGAFKITSAPNGLPDHCLISLTSYTGIPHTLRSIRRGSAWSALDGSKILIRRSGVWGQINGLRVWRSGAWKDV